MHVTVLAKLAGLEAQVVRCHKQTDLLLPRRDPKNHYRQYAHPDVYTLRFIRRARSLGFTLKDIKAISSDADSERSGDFTISIKRITAIVPIDVLQKMEKHLFGCSVLGVNVEQAQGYGEHPNFVCCRLKHRNFAMDCHNACVRS